MSSLHYTLPMTASNQWLNIIHSCKKICNKIKYWELNVQKGFLNEYYCYWYDSVFSLHGYTEAWVQTLRRYEAIITSTGCAQKYETKNTTELHIRVPRNRKKPHKCNQNSSPRIATQNLWLVRDKVKSSPLDCEQISSFLTWSQIGECHWVGMANTT